MLGRAVLVLLLLGPSAWAADAPKLIARLDHAQGVAAAAFLPDPKSLVVATRNGLFLWDARTHRQQWTSALPAPATLLGCSDDGRLLACGHADGTLSLWTVAEGKRLIHFQSEHGIPGSVAFSPDGTLLASGGANRLVKLWDVATGRERARFQRQSAWWVGSVAFSPDGARLYAGGYDGNIRVWTVATGEQLHQWPAIQFTGIALSPDGRTLATNGDGNSIRLIETATGKMRQQFGQHGPMDLWLAFSGDGRTLAERAKQEAVVRVWDRTTGQKVAQVDGAGPAALSSNGRTIAVGHGNAVHLWELPARAMPPGEQMDAGRMVALWADLADGDAAKAYVAVLALAAQPGRGVPLLRERLLGMGGEEAPDVARLIAGLDDDEFRKREAASAALAGLGAKVEPALRKALDERPSAEARLRIEAILRQLNAAVPTDEQLRIGRALESLELVGTVQAADALNDIVGSRLPLSVRTDAARGLRRLHRLLGRTTSAPNTTRPTQ